MLTRSISRLFTLAYVPFGPAFDPVTKRGEYLYGLARALRPHLPANTILTRFDLPWERTGEAPGSGVARIRKSRDDIQPPATVVVDIQPPPEKILSAMKSKTRYNIRLAAKKGVEVTEGTAGDVDAWYELYRQTGARDGIAIHAKTYYADLLSRPHSYPGRSPIVKLLMARADGELLAGNIVVFWKDNAAYLYGASSNERRNLMPTYALQWEAIRQARDAGCRTYDLYGIPPQADPSHPMFGLYQFKTGFSDRVLERWGTWDAAYLPARAAVYALAERARMFFFRSLKKRRIRGARVSAAASADAGRSEGGAGEGASPEAASADAGTGKDGGG